MEPRGDSCVFVIHQLFDKVQRNHDFGPTRLRFHTFSLISKGTGYYELGDDAVQYTVHGGSLLWMPHLTLRYAGAGDEGMHMYAIRFQVRGSEPETLPAVMDDECLRPGVVRLSCPSYVESLFRVAQRIWVERAPLYRLEVQGILLQIISHYLRDRRRDAEKPGLMKMQEQLQPVLDYVSERFHDPDLDLEKLAQLAGCSQRHLTRMFRTVLGTTPVGYIKRLRVNLSIDMLASGEFTVAEVAERVGYTDPSYFSRVFTQVMGRPPSAFKPNSGISGA